MRTSDFRCRLYPSASVLASRTRCPHDWRVGVLPRAAGGRADYSSRVLRTLVSPLARTFARFAVLPCALLCTSASAPAEPTSVPRELGAQEVRQVLGYGPWPPPARRDAGNRVSGNAKAIELGRQLFRDPRMSPVGYIACVTCHQPDRAFTDIKARAHGMADLPRNTPALANLRLQRWYGWGGASDSLWMASVKPILDAREFDGNPALVARLFAREPDLAACYRAVFGASPLRQPHQTVVVNVGKALAAYVETLVSGRTPFDDFRDALARGDASAAAQYPADALRGLRVFIGRGCATCHRGPNFSDGDFHPGAPAHDDGGRLDDARYLKASRFNLLGAYNDDGSRANANATRQLALHDGLRGRFRTPTLRNVAVTAPYFHDGQVDRLVDAVQHASLGNDDAQPLLMGEIDDLVAFLATLTDSHGARRPWNPAGLTRCR